MYPEQPYLAPFRKYGIVKVGFGEIGVQAQAVDCVLLLLFFRFRRQHVDHLTGSFAERFGSECFEHLVGRKLVRHLIHYSLRGRDVARHLFGTTAILEREEYPIHRIYFAPLFAC